MKTKPAKPNGWEQDFEKEFQDLNNLYPETGETLKSFISKTILSAEENLLREIMEEMPNGDVATSLEPREIAWSKGWNDYRNQVNTLLESKLSTVKKT